MADIASMLAGIFGGGGGQPQPPPQAGSYYIDPETGEKVYVEPNETTDAAQRFLLQHAMGAGASPESLPTAGIGGGGGLGELVQMIMKMKKPIILDKYSKRMEYMPPRTVPNPQSTAGLE